jgi:alpha-galactosidase
MNALDSYSFRSAMCCGMIGCWDLRQPDLDYTLLRTLMAQWRQLASLFLADYYPLTPYSLKNDTWMAWQFDDPEQGRGLIQAFRRDQSPTDSLTIRLHGLDPESRYLLTDLDTNHQDRYSGAELMKNGFTVHLPQKPGASLMTYIKQG